MSELEVIARFQVERPSILGGPAERPDSVCGNSQEETMQGWSGPSGPVEMDCLSAGQTDIKSSGGILSLSLQNTFYFGYCPPRLPCAQKSISSLRLRGQRVTGRAGDGRGGDRNKSHTCVRTGFSSLLPAACT